MPSVRVLQDVEARRIRATHQYPVFTSLLAAGIDTTRRCQALLQNCVNRGSTAGTTSTTTTTVHCALRELCFRVECTTGWSCGCSVAPHCCPSALDRLLTDDEALMASLADMAALCGHLSFVVSALTAAASSLPPRTAATNDVLFSRCWSRGAAGQPKQPRGLASIGERDGSRHGLCVVLHASRVFDPLPVRRVAFTRGGNHPLLREELRRVLACGYRLAVTELLAPLCLSGAAETAREIATIAAAAASGGDGGVHRFALHLNSCPCDDYDLDGRCRGFAAAELPNVVPFPPWSADCGCASFMASTEQASDERESSRDAAVSRVAALLLRSFYPSAVEHTDGTRGGNSAAQMSFRLLPSQPPTGREAGPLFSVLVATLPQKAAVGRGGSGRWGDTAVRPLIVSWYHVEREPLLVAVDDSTCAAYYGCVSSAPCHCRDSNSDGTVRNVLLVVAHPKYLDRREVTPTARLVQTHTFDVAFANAMNANGARSDCPPPPHSPTPEVSTAMNTTAAAAAVVARRRRCPPCGGDRLLPPARPWQPQSTQLRFQFVLHQISPPPPPPPCCAVARAMTSRALPPSAAGPRRTPVLRLQQAARPSALTGDAVADLARSRQQLATDLSVGNPLALLPRLTLAAPLKGWTPPCRHREARTEEGSDDDAWPPFLRGGGGQHADFTVSYPRRSTVASIPWAQKFILFVRAGVHTDDEGEEEAAFARALRDRGKRDRPPPLASSLWVADQHAVHERLRLEFFCSVAEASVLHPELAAEFAATHGAVVGDAPSAEKLWAYRARVHALLRRSQNTPAAEAPAAPRLARIPADIVPLVNAAQEALRWWGWRFESSRTLYVTHWPVARVEGFELALSTMAELHTMAAELTAHSPQTWVIPSAVLQFFISRSCRGAIMFGDSLSPCQAHRLLSDLAQVEQFYLCSHGRPSLAKLSPL